MTTDDLGIVELGVEYEKAEWVTSCTGATWRNMASESRGILNMIAFGFR